MQLCPKCGYKRQADDNHVMEGICPSCGIAYQKWLQNQHQQLQASVSEERSHQHQPAEEDAVEIEYLEEESLRERIAEILLCQPDKIDPVVFWGRCLTFLLFFIWGWSFIIAGISVEKIMGSFLHNIILPFHEFGHVLFSPFGRFMAILGGSLFQVLMPLGLAGAFIYYNRDAFAASLMVWWCGHSFIDLSPYIADATYRSLPLIAGMGEEAHDWGNILGTLGMLRHDYTIAKISFGIGALLMIISWIWGLWVLFSQKRLMDELS